ncbi:CIC11C00000002307 [Sungouiella intermedia]|uniref:CIC11C00000002307 n=1 Tax=Sungouiella intermedia TaxID=45354 RepID=A0A1L0DG85_9ASCO|nr:CIC11C00000003899 [[Candida] intermedia]SGZ54944.1 CIC11C00000002307 [[Candida] intermedia]
MTEEIDIPSHREDDEGLDNPLRAIIVVNSPDVPDGEMEERMLDSIQTFDEVDKFFDTFDETVAYPNKDHIKYEVGSDGLVVFVVDLKKLKDDVLKFIDEFVTEFDDQLVDEVVAKKQKK